MRKVLGPLSLLLLSINSPAYSYYNTPRLYLWGLSGSESIARADMLLPLAESPFSIFYTDVQGKVGGDNAWFAGAGAGYRSLSGNNIYGGYLFYDRNVSPIHNVFYIVNPGFEVINNDWDARANLYFPVSEKQKRGPSFFPSGDNACGIHDNCDFVEFHGHQQFEHRFFDFEEVAIGGDAQVGTTFNRLHNLAVHGGIYYYQFDHSSDMGGVQAHAEYPLNNTIDLTVESSYDNKDKFGIIGGFRVKFGPVPGNRPMHIVDHFYDPVERYLGRVKTGAGIPSIQRRQDEGLFLRRDNIYFFTATGGTTFAGPGTGTFENPLRADQFSSGTLAAVQTLTGNGNFYFNTGVYGLGATSVTVLQGQSLYGRSADYRCTANGDERPVLNFAQTGTAALIVTGGNNVIESLILQNIVTGPNTVIALDVEDNFNLFICNSVIDAEAIVVGDNAGLNIAIGITANNSRVTIDPTVIQAKAFVSGANAGFNAAIGIGSSALTSIPTSFTNNNFILNDTLIIARSHAFDNFGLNGSFGIGNVLGSFTGNTFYIHHSILDSRAEVDNLNFAGNFALGVGNTGTAMNDNIFALVRSQITTSAITQGNNAGINAATGIGEVDGGFNDNIVMVFNSSILANNFIGENNLNRGFAIGIGGAAGLSLTNNTINIDQSNIIARSNATNQIGSFNTAASLGVSFTLITNNNIFNVNDSFCEATSDIAGSQDAGSINQASIVNSTSFIPPNANIFNINNSQFLVQTLIDGNNAGVNRIVGLFANASTTVNVANSFFDIISIVKGVNTGTNAAFATAGTGTFNIINTEFNIVQNP